MLDAGEKLFARQGVDGTSVRDIVKVAGVNLGSVNYYFGSKDRLVVEVFMRRLEPINRERIARLDALEAATEGQSIRLEEIIDALVRPAMEGGDDREDFMRLMSRCLVEPNEDLKKSIEKEFAEIARRFDSAILRAVPGLPPEEMFWRMSFLFGALHHGQQQWAGFDQIPKPSELQPIRPDREGFIQRLIAFGTAGFTASIPNNAHSKIS